MLKSIVEQYKKSFNINDVINIDNLPGNIKTSFSWSEEKNSLCLAMNQKYFDQALINKNIVGIVTTPAAFKNSTFQKDKTIIVSKKADELFYFIHNSKIHLSDSNDQQDNTYVSPNAVISSSASLGDNVYIGDNVTIHHGCVICDNTVIKRDTVLHPYVTIGTEGFFSKYILGSKVHVKHYGGVEIGENCIIHTGSNISRSVNYGERTELGDNVHVGIHSNIGHDCKIGHDSDISAKVLLAGRVRVGRKCWIGAGVTISNALLIADNASIKIGSVVIEDVACGKTVSGNFALDHNQHLRTYLKAKKR